MLQNVGHLNFVPSQTSLTSTKVTEKFSNIQNIKLVSPNPPWYISWWCIIWYCRY